LPELVPHPTALVPAQARRPREDVAARPRSAPTPLSPATARPSRQSPVGLAGQAIFRCADPRFDGKPPAVADAELEKTIVVYLDGIDHSIENAQGSMALLKSRGVLDDIARAATDGPGVSIAPWLGVLASFQRAKGLFAAARTLGERPEGLANKARLVAQAIAVADAAMDEALRLGREHGDFLARKGETARVIAKNIERGRDIAIAIVISQGLVTFAPAFGGGAAGVEGALVAPTTLGGTLAGFGQAALVGATVRGAVLTTGTLLGGGDLDAVSRAAGDGMRDGAVDGVLSPLSGAATKGLTGATGAPMDVPVGVATGLAGGAAKGALAGQRGEALRDSAAQGAAEGGLAGAVSTLLKP